MSLGDYGGGGGNWFQPGLHRVFVQSYKNFSANTGSRGFEFMFGDGQRQIRDSIYAWDAGGQPMKSLWKLVRLAEACGYTEQQIKMIDERDYNSVVRLCESMLNKQIEIEVIKGKDKGDGKRYSEVESFAKIEQPTNLPPRPSASPRSAPPQAPPAVGPGGWPVKDDLDCPF